jgi:hypothetical protein
MRIWPFKEYQKDHPHQGKQAVPRGLFLRAKNVERLLRADEEEYAA